jgi:hypothetical protein
MGWLPIDPRLDPKTGAFAAFSGMPNGKDLKPAPYNKDRLSSYYGREDFVSMSAAVSLGVTPAATVGAEYGSWVFTYDAMMFAETSASPPNGGLIYATRWGAGFRMTLQVWNLTANVNLSLAALAASADLGVVKSSYEITGYGFVSPSILNTLPGPGRFDRTNYQRILDAGTAIQKYMLQHAQDPNISPVPFQVLMAAPDLGAPLSETQSAVFAMRSIAKRRALSKTLSSDNASRFDSSVIRSTYASVVKDAGGAPSTSEADYANAWTKFERN